MIHQVFKCLLSATCVISLHACEPASKNELPADKQTDTSWTEKIEGEVGGNKVVFSHQRFEKYTLLYGDSSMSGSLNTERGFNGDADATLYVLNYDEPESARWYFVRFTGDSVFMLKRDRTPDKCSELKLRRR